jgi:hypothetical protein
MHIKQLLLKIFERKNKCNTGIKIRREVWIMKEILLLCIYVHDIYAGKHSMTCMSYKGLMPILDVIGNK